MKAEFYWIEVIQCALQCNEKFSMWKQKIGLFWDERAGLRSMAMWWKVALLRIFVTEI